MPVDLSNDHSYNGAQARLQVQGGMDNLRDLNHNHSLGSHLATAVNIHPRTGFQAYSLGNSPDPLLFQEDSDRQGQGQGQSQNQPDASGSRPQSDSQAGNKRKDMDGMNGSPGKKRRSEGDFGGEDGTGSIFGDEQDDGDMDTPGIDFVLGAPKHWTDEDKTKFFSWLMGHGQDEHWNALRASKNACFRECAEQLFNGKKTMQALKGAYERGFNVFKQIYAFEIFSRRMGPMTINMNSQADRLKEYERRLQAARKDGCEVGNINARIIEHWRIVGWYDLFYRRWHGDPVSTRPVNRQFTVGPTASSSAATAMDEDAEVEEQLSGGDYHLAQNADGHGERPFTGESSASAAMHNPSNMHFPPNSQFLVPQITHVGNGNRGPVQNSIADQTLAQLTTLTQSMMTTYVQLLQSQSEDVKLKMEYTKRREAREELESRQRREAEQRRLEREAAEWEHSKLADKIKQKTTMATELLSAPGVDSSVKQAAGDYLKRLFMAD